MDYLLSWIMKYWFSLTSVMSLYWGFRGGWMEYWKCKQLMNREPTLFTSFVWITYQFIFNFVGSVMGWCCTYVLIDRIQNNFPMSLNISDFVLFFISFLGITGHLPQSLYGIVVSIGSLMNAATNKIVK
ncbi:MAG: hypothetical protein HY881_12820 [Deltaproteobacteria bacterium]|nr:hypothetical protein [Deltaproteobacteria bacterium]